MKIKLKSTNKNQDILSVKKIIKNFTRNDSLIVEYPNDLSLNRINEIRDLLKKELQDFKDFNIFYCGHFENGKCINILKLISSKIILENADKIMKTIESFRVIANILLKNLTNKFDLPYTIESLEKIDYNINIGEGKIDDNWHFYFHGEDCQFTNISTGQKLEVYYLDYTFIDPYFLLCYIETTPEYEELHKLFQNSFNDFAHALDVLEENGYDSQVVRNI